MTNSLTRAHATDHLADKAMPSVWHPIRTAPRDRDFLIRFTNSTGVMVTLARWSDYFCNQVFVPHNGTEPSEVAYGHEWTDIPR